MKPRSVWELAWWISAFVVFSAAASAAPDSRPGPWSVGAKVADWQLAHMTSFDYIPSDQRHGTESPRDWVQAAFYIGLSHFADASGNDRYAAAVLGSRHGGKLGI